MTMGASQDEIKNKAIVHFKTSTVQNKNSNNHDQDTVFNNAATCNYIETVWKSSFNNLEKKTNCFSLRHPLARKQTSVVKEKYKKTMCSTNKNAFKI